VTAYQADSPMPTSLWQILRDPLETRLALETCGPRRGPPVLVKDWALYAELLKRTMGNAMDMDQAGGAEYAR